MAYVIDAISLEGTQQLGVQVLKPGGKLVLTLGATSKAVYAAARKGVDLRGSHGASHMYPEFK